MQRNMTARLSFNPNYCLRFIGRIKKPKCQCIQRPKDTQKVKLAIIHNVVGKHEEDPYTYHLLKYLEIWQVLGYLGTLFLW